MERTPVESTNIRSVGYYPDSKTLEIEFHGGEIYHYYDVPETVYQQLTESASAGSYFNLYVRYAYDYMEI